MTLIELAVILTILALLAAFAVPELTRAYDSLRFRLQRDDIERQLSALQMRAYLDGRNYLLLSQPPQSVEERNLQAESLRFYDAEPAPIKLPPGFSLQLPGPILFRYNGLCDGGRLTVKLEKFSYIYQMVAPRCQPTEP